MKKIILTLEENEMAALEKLARKEFRNPWQEAVFIIRKELEKQKLISDIDLLEQNQIVDKAPNRN
jgi:hypothetical protein